MVFNSHKRSILQLYLGNLANKLPGGGGEIYSHLVFKFWHHGYMSYIHIGVFLLLRYEIGPFRFRSGHLNQDIQRSEIIAIVGKSEASYLLEVLVNQSSQLCFHLSLFRSTNFLLCRIYILDVQTLCCHLSLPSLPHNLSVCTCYCDNGYYVNMTHDIF